MVVADPLIEALVGKQPYYVVLRRCTVGGQPRVRGEVFDTTGIPSSKVASLVTRRYVFQLPYGLKAPELEEQDDGYERRMLPVDAIDATAQAKRKAPRAKAKKPVTKAAKKTTSSSKTAPKQTEGQ